MKKRVLAILLCLIMTVSLLPMAAFAATGKPHGPADTTYKMLTVADIDSPVIGAAPDTEATVRYIAKGTKKAIDTTADVLWGELKGGVLKSIDPAKDTFKANGLYLVAVAHRLDSTSSKINDFKVRLDDQLLEKMSFDDLKTLPFDGSADQAVFSYDAENRTIIVMKAFAKLAHEHAAGTEWKSDETNHWNECTICGEKLNVAAHADTNHDGKCDVCGHEVALVHPFDTAWTSDETHHWHKCTVEGCTEISDKAEHVDADKDGKCDVCAYVMTAPHVHVPGEDWKHDETNHWHECVGCGIKLDVAAHADANGDGKCDDCGFVMSKPHEHTWSDKWYANSKEHWHECTDCKEKKDVGAHVDTNNNGKCDTCGYEMGIEIKTHTELNITLDVPKANSKVPFTASTAPSGEYGNVSVKWNKVTNLAAGKSVPLANGDSFAAGNMYNTGIQVKYSVNEALDPNLKVTLNGQTVPYYASGKDAAKALNAYNGANQVSAAYPVKLSNGEVAVMVCAMYPKLEGAHTHVFSKDWLEDANYHWKACECGEIAEKGAHFDNNGTGKCDVCGHDMKDVTNHQHNFGKNWLHDKSFHWQQCSCGAIANKAVHFDNNKTGKCDVCGFPMADAVKPATGDDSNIALWAGILVLSGVALAVPVVLKLRRKHNEG